MKSYLKYSKLFFRAMVAFWLILWLFRKTDMGAMRQILLNINLGWLSIAIVIFSLAILASVIRWSVLLKATSIGQIALWRLARSQIVSLLFNVFLPADIGGDIYKAYDIGTVSGDRIASTTIIILQRMFGLLSNGLFLFLGLFISFSFIPVPEIRWISIAVSLASLTVFVMLIKRDYLFGLINIIFNRITTRSKWKSLLYDATNTIQVVCNNRRLLLIVIACGLAYYTLLVGLVFSYGKTLGISLTDRHLFLVVSLIYLVAAIPLSISSLGIREGAFVFFLGWLGISLEQSLSIAVLSRVVGGLIFPLSGGLIFLFCRPTKVSLKKYNTNNTT